MKIDRLHPPPQLDNLSRHGLHTYFREGWELEEQLFASVDPGALNRQPDPLRHPLIFYYGHSAAFFINKLRMAGLRPRGLDDHLDTLLARGVDPATRDDLTTFAWPSKTQVSNYRANVYTIVSELINALDLPQGPVDAGNPLWALLMALEHQRIHFETSSVLIRQLPTACVAKPDMWDYASCDRSPAVEPRWLEYAPKTVTVGRPAALAQYYWDNEVGSLRVDVDRFFVRSTLVTNAEFLEFWRAGGYHRRELWSDRGWAWRSRHEVTHPRFWVDCEPAAATAARPRYRAMFDTLALPPHWPVEVNAHEAWAYCAYIGNRTRLPSEAEYMRITATAPLTAGDCIDHHGYNLNLRYASARAVGAASSCTTPEGLADPFGNVWQWLVDDFYPLPGFTPHPYYRDFSAPYFDRDHAMLKGGSWASTGTSASRWYRLWFRHHFYQHAGFRLASSATPEG